MTWLQDGFLFDTWRPGSCFNITTVFPYIGPIIKIKPQIAKFMVPTWGPPGSCRPPDGPHVGPMNLVIRDGFTDVLSLLWESLYWWDNVFALKRPRYDIYSHRWTESSLVPFTVFSLFDMKQLHDQHSPIVNWAITNKLEISSLKKMH